MRPPTIQQRIAVPGAVRFAATTAGTLKIPLLIMVPTTTAVALPTPITRGRRSSVPYVRNTPYRSVVIVPDMPLHGGFERYRPGRHAAAERGFRPGFVVARRVALRSTQCNTHYCCADM